MPPTPHILARRVQEPPKLERVARRLINVFEAIRPEMDPAKIARHNDEHVIHLQNMQQMRETPPCCRLSIIVVICKPFNIIILWFSNVSRRPWCKRLPT